MKVVPKEGDCPLVNPPGTIHYYLYGKGSTKVVFQMGLNTTGLFYDYIVNELEKKGKLGDLQVCLFDSRGVYKSTGCFFPGYNTTKMAEDMSQLMDFLGWQKAHIAGISQGGMVMQEFCLKYPYRVQSSLFMSTYAGGSPFSLLNVNGVYHIIMYYLGSSSSRVYHMNGFLLNNKASDEVIKDRIDLALKNPFSIMRVIPHVLGCASHYRSVQDIDTISALPFPKRVVVGTEDNLIYPECSRLLAEYLQAPLVELKGHGHGLETTAPSELADALLDNIAASAHYVPPAAKYAYHNYTSDFKETLIPYLLFLRGFLICFLACSLCFPPIAPIAGVFGGIISAFFSYLGRYPVSTGY